MLDCESTIIESMLSFAQGVQVLNVCSGDHWFRHVCQPFIHNRVIQPLINRSCNVVNLDMKKHHGVDIVDDCQKMEQVKTGSFDVAIWTNAIEHMLNPELCVAAIARVLKPGGYLLASGPGSYPYHADPIDTMFRIPTLEAWKKVLEPRFEVLTFRSTEATPIANGGWASIVLAKTTPGRA